MTPAEFKAIRHTLGLSAQGLARVLGVSDGRTVRRWEADDRKIPGPVTILMWLLNDGMVKPNDIETAILCGAIRSVHRDVLQRQS